MANILIIDTLGRISGFAARLLRGMRGHNTTVVPSSQKALEVLTQTKPDLVVVDANSMPFVEAVKDPSNPTYAAFSHIPLIGIGAVSDEQRQHLQLYYPGSLTHYRLLDSIDQVFPPQS